MQLQSQPQCSYNGCTQFYTDDNPLNYKDCGHPICLTHLELLAKDQQDEFFPCIQCPIQTCKQMQDFPLKLLKENMKMKCSTLNLEDQLPNGNNMNQFICQKHPDQQIRFYCETEKEFLCQMCYNQHSGHAQMIKQYSDLEMKVNLKDCQKDLLGYKNKIDKITTQINRVLLNNSVINSDTLKKVMNDTQELKLQLSSNPQIQQKQSEMIQNKFSDSEARNKKLIEENQSLKKEISDLVNKQNQLEIQNKQNLQEIKNLKNSPSQNINGQLDQSNSNVSKNAQSSSQAVSQQNIEQLKIGDMPDGKMYWTLRDDIKLTDFDCKTIVILYKFKSGISEKGILYEGTIRNAFLPHNDEGINILKMLILAFQQRLTFTVGKSMTTGKDNQIVWAGIVHKSYTSKGPFGFPDPLYYEDIQKELALRGINLKKVEHIEIDFQIKNRVKIMNGKCII